MIRKKQLILQLQEKDERIRVINEQAAKQVLDNVKLKAQINDLVELNKLLVASNGELHEQVRSLEYRLDVVIQLNRELKSKLERASEVFGEAFVKGGELPPQKGADRPNRKKLTKQEVKDIRKAFRGGMKQKDLADNYGVNPATISRIVRGIYH